MPRIKKEVRYIQLIVFAVAAIVYIGIKSIPASKNPAVSDEFFYVVRVTDGDTLKLSTNEKVRLIGVDTPELHYSDKLLRDAKRSRRDIKTIQALGKRASDFTRALCLDRKVRLEFDVEKRDRYGRQLAYVYLEDGTFVNAKIIEEGYGQVMTIPPNVKYADYFLKLEKVARHNHKGLWSAAETL